MNVECDIQLSKDYEAAKKEINYIIMTSAKPMIGDMMSLVDSYVRNTSHIRAIILLQGVSKLHGAGSALHGVEGIKQCLDKTLEALKPMIKGDEKMKAIATEVVLPSMREMYAQIRAMDHKNADDKALVSAESLLRLSAGYFMMENFYEMARTCRQGIEILDKQFGSLATEHVIHGWLLLSLGTSSDKLGSTSTAINCLQQTVETFKNAKDINTEREQRDNIAKAKSFLQRLMKRKLTN